MNTLDQIWQIFTILFLQSRDAITYVLVLVPFVLFLELPLYLSCWMGVFQYIIKKSFEPPAIIPHYPRVTCTITCYAEGKSVQSTVNSLLEQVYPGHIEIIAVVDGAHKNRDTFEALKVLRPLFSKYLNRSFIIIPKSQRGGRVSSMNAGLNRASGEVFLALDGDTSFDNQMIFYAARHFHNPNTVAVTGPMRVRNANQSLVTRLQSLEYMLTMQVGKLGLAKLDVINNVPGAFGVFRKSFVKQMGGWNTGTAEDLDMTLRLKQYKKRHPKLQIDFEPYAVSHTDVPKTFIEFFKQRLRWDGDLWYIYANKHSKGISASIMGWRNFIFLLWYGIFFQAVMPFAIVLYTTYMAIILDPLILTAVMIFIYLFYFLLTLIQFILYLVFISDRKWEDSRAFLVLPIFPFFQFIVRVWSALAFTNEIINKGHMDSSMAPWWVLKKGQ